MGKPRHLSRESEKLGLEPVSTNAFGDLRYEAGGVEFLVYRTELAGTNQATAAGFRLENFEECEREDSNLHGCYPTGT